MNTEDELPHWVGILERGPLDMDKLSPAEVEQEFKIRFGALLASNGCDATFDGWRETAIALAIAFHPAFRVQKRQRVPVSGAPLQSSRWLYKSAVTARVRRLQAEEQDKTSKSKRTKAPRLQAKAARQVHTEFSRARERAAEKQRGKSSNLRPIPTAKTLQNIASDHVPFPIQWTKDDHLLDAKIIAIRASKRL